METVQQPRLAFWGERFLAWLVDIAILGALIGLIRVFVWLSWPAVPIITPVPSWIPLSDFGFGNLVYFLYWMLMEGVYGRSLGKMLMRLKVTRLNGQPINMTQSAIESVGKAFILPIDLIVGWILHPRSRQRIFNYLSGTVVVKA